MYFEFMRLIIVIGFILLAFAIGCYYAIPLLNERELVLAHGDTVVQNILNKTSVSCNDIISLRLDHTNGKIFFSHSVEDQLRNVYNIKSCGTHWGWFEP